ncbi:MAG: hypothetical protein ACRC2R_12360 [Xenococcaceae cyanobacterium]
MNLCKRFLPGFCVSCSLLAIAIPARADRVQTYLDTQLLSQASELEGLEQKDISDWGFTSDRRNVLPREEDEKKSPSQPQGLRIDSDVNLRFERNEKTWESDGDKKDDALVFDLYRE